MIPYWLLFLVPTLLAISEFHPVGGRFGSRSGSWHAIFLLLALMIGLRHEVGGDWFMYQDNLNSVSILSLQEALSQGDVAYQFLEWLFGKSDLGVYWVNLVCAVVFSWGLIVFCRAQPRPFLTLVVAIPYLVTVVAMGYTRQGVAIGLVMVGLVALSNQNVLRFVVFVIAAALFHKSAVILLPLAVLSNSKRKVWTAFWVVASSVIFYALLLQDSVSELKSGYLVAQMQSQGAAIRVSMNVVPAMFFLFFRRKFVMPETERIFWTWMSLGALGFVVMLMLSPSSTAVDRLALYWIPLQLFVLSRLPNAIGSPKGRNKKWVSAVVFYSAAVLFVWLFFAQTAFAWLPYQFYPLVWLMQ